jgi:hypothetical protein
VRAAGLERTGLRPEDSLTSYGLSPQSNVIADDFPAKPNRENPGFKQLEEQTTAEICISLAAEKAHRLGLGPSP